MTDGVHRAARGLRRAGAGLGRLALILAISFALLEIAARIRAGRPPESNHLDLEITRTALPPPYAGRCGGAADAPLGSLIRPSPVPDLLFELKRGLDTCFFGARATISAEGFRAPRSYGRDKPDGTYRVLLLGDSQTFGQGVTYEQTWGALLERELQRRAPERRVEVINTGVPAYNTVQEAAFFAAEGVEYHPDCAVVLFIGNDVQLSEFLLDPEPGGLALDRSFAIDALRDIAWFLRRRFMVDTTGVRPSLLERVPAKYRHLVGLDAYEGALRRIAATARAAGVSVVDIADYKPLGFRARQRRNLDELRRLHEELGISEPPFDYPGGPRYWLSETEHHLSALGNAELERRVVDGVRRGCRGLE
jgi:hypothetical protein